MTTIQERLRDVLGNEDGSADDAPLGLCEEAAAHIDAIEKRAQSAEARVAELSVVLQEVLRISDRKHAAWDLAKTVLSASGVDVLARGWWTEYHGAPSIHPVPIGTIWNRQPVRNETSPCLVIRTDAAQPQENTDAP